MHENILEICILTHASLTVTTQCEYTITHVKKNNLSMVFFRQ